MAKRFLEVKRFGGISDSDKEGLVSTYFFGRSIDYRTDPTKLLILPRTVKESGNIVTDLPMVGERVGTDVYAHGDTGNIYKRDSSKDWTLQRSVANSQGNGLAYFGEDDFLYYPSNTVIGRFGPTNGTAEFVDDFLGAEGGVPTNTNSLDFEAGSSQYADRVDTVDLSITADLTLEINANAESLPSSGNTMTLMSKWSEQSNDRSYKMDIGTVSNFFGDGSDGALTISSNTTEAPIDSAATATSGTQTITATNASFAAGQKILIHQTQGTGAGTYEIREIQAYSAPTITTTEALTATYTSGAQVRVLKQHTNVTVNTGITYTAKAWNGTVGGILGWFANGTTTITGTLSGNGATGGTATGDGVYGGRVNGGGFRGGDGFIKELRSDGDGGQSGESFGGDGTQKDNTANNGGGGAGKVNDVGGHDNAAGGGAGYVAAGDVGSSEDFTIFGGELYGSSDLSSLHLGSGGGGAYKRTASKTVGAGGNGGAILFVNSVDFVVTGIVSSDGGDGGTGFDTAHGGGGSGGSILIKCQTATLGSDLVTASGVVDNPGSFGNSSAGRIHIDYLTSFTGTTSPTTSSAQDNALGSTDGYSLRLLISDDGTAEEIFKKTINISTGVYTHLAVSFDASASLATFYQDRVSLGTQTQTMTSIDDNASRPALAADFDSAGDDQNHFDGLLDDARWWSKIRTANEIAINGEKEMGGSEAGLKAYHELDGDVTDTAGSNDLTLQNAPTYSTVVAFSGVTARNDLDQSLDTSGQTYALAASITESNANSQFFIPTKDPQKSVEVNINTIGTGTWTLAVHDSLNREVASKTVAIANLNTGDFEFIFDSVWRPVIGATYHFHITNTGADGLVVTTGSNDLDTADFHTYWQFLVSDKFHPAKHFTTFLAIANERYLATWNGTAYNPHKLTLPSGFRIRALGTWREYLVMGVTRGTNLNDYDQGLLVFWDGTADNPNFQKAVPQGGINAIVSGDPMWFFAGYSGDLMKFDGSSLKLVRRMPKMDGKKTMEVFPGGMNMWRSLIHMGIAGDSNSTVLEKGVYSHGSIRERLGDTLSFDYPLSIGTTTGTAIDTGMVFPTGSELLIGWKNANKFGVDVVAPTNSPFATARLETLITDSGKIRADKMSNYMRAYFKKIVSGDSFQFEYKIDRQSSWVEVAAESTAGKKETRFSLPRKGNKFNELQVAIEISTSNSVSPEFYGFGAEIEDLGGERRV